MLQQQRKGDAVSVRQPHHIPIYQYLNRRRVTCLVEGARMAAALSSCLIKARSPAPPTAPASAAAIYSRSVEIPRSPPSPPNCLLLQVNNYSYLGCGLCGDDMGSADRLPHISATGLHSQSTCRPPQSPAYVLEAALYICSIRIPITFIAP